MRQPLLCLTLSFLIVCPNALSQHLEPTPDRDYFPAHHTLITPASPSGSASLSLVPLATRDDQGSLALTIGSSLLFGSIGFFAGGLAGDALTDDCGYDCLEGVIFGVLIGTPVGTAVGAHIGNGRRGSLGYDLLAGLGGSALGTVILAVSSDDETAILLAGASVVALPVLAERMSAARRARARRVVLAAAPTRHGFGVGLRVTLGG